MLESVQQGLEPSGLDLIVYNCFCGALSYGRAAKAAWSSSDPCNAYWLDKTPTFGLTSLASVVVSAVNLLMQYTLESLSHWERHHSLVNRELSIARRIFLALLINTGFVVLLVNIEYPALREKAVFIGAGDFSDFTADWYSSVGLQICFTMVVNIVGPHTATFGGYLWWLFRRNFFTPTSQRQINEWYLGPTFHLNYRVAQLLMTVFVTLLYSAGMPILYPVAFLSFGMFYLVDKWLFLRYYRKPPAYGPRISQWASTVITWAVVGHLCLAIWMYSAPGVFNNNSQAVLSPKAYSLVFGVLGDRVENTFRNRISLANTIPLVGALLVILLWKLANYIFGKLGRLRHDCCTSVTCGLFDDGMVNVRYLNPPLQEVRETGNLQGLQTYNILGNPRYARAFAIDESFAETHSHVASVHDLPSMHIPKLPGSLGNARAAIVPSN